MSNADDRKILNSLVNPLLPLGEGVFDDQDQIPVGLRDDEEPDTPEIRYAYNRFCR